MNAVPLAMVEVSDRSGRLLVRHAVRHWPLTIGRALSADLVLDDPHVAGEHLRLDRDAEGVLRAQVLDTVNGVALGACICACGWRTRRWRPSRRCPGSPGGWQG